MVRGDGSRSVKKHGCWLYGADSLSFVHVNVGLMNVAGVFMSDLDVNVLAIYKTPSNSHVQNENFFFFFK